ncbi:MAG: ABC transporter ATP-binding protein [Acidobacteria bacterium]|nr:ABC transporter ATP-binding protein [Acidobacteriota bacterium]MCB9397820.1 ABC transporter ATP-binding protein [Acidobacteriota bacterium]
MTETIARWQSVNQFYGKHHALKDLDVELKAGQVTALLGPNGAGKTTAIKLILGLLTPSKGSVSLFGKSPHRREARVHIGAMLQAGSVPETLTVREHFQVFRSYYPNPLPLESLLQKTQLESCANQRFGRLSGGQKQRVLFGLALAGNPELLFLDEPTVGMDILSRRQFWQSIQALRNQGKTILVTTHYLEEAQAIADRVIVLDKGQLIADMNPHTLRSQFGRKKVAFRCADLRLDQVESHGQILSHEGDRWQLLCDEPESFLRWALAHFNELTELEIQPLTLEDAYLALTENVEEAV